MANDVPQSIINQVKTMLEMTERESTNTNEAAVAAAKMQRLVMKYNLDLDEIRRKRGDADKSVPYELESQDLPGPASAAKEWRIDVCASVAQFNFGTTVLTRFKDGRVVMRYIAQRHNLEVITYLSSYLVREIWRLANAAWNEMDEVERGYYGKSRWLTSFCITAANTVGYRMQQERDEEIKAAQPEQPARQAEPISFEDVAAQAAAGLGDDDLVQPEDDPATVNPTQALIVRTEQELDDAKASFFPKLGKARARSRHDGYGSAILAGREAGNSIPLHKGLGAGSQPALGGK